MNYQLKPNVPKQLGFVQIAVQKTFITLRQVKVKVTVVYYL